MLCLSFTCFLNACTSWIRLFKNKVVVLILLFSKATRISTVKSSLCSAYFIPLEKVQLTTGFLSGRNQFRFETWSFSIAMRLFC